MHLRHSYSIEVIFLSAVLALTASTGFASEQFDQAHQLFQRGRSLQHLHQNTDDSRRVLQAAYEGYVQTLEQDPNGKLAARALYMSASTKLFLGQPREAIQIYRRVPERYPQDRYYVAKSLLRMAAVEKGILQADAARATLAEYQREFPDGAPRNLNKEANRIEKSLSFIGKTAPQIAASHWLHPSSSKETPKLTALFFFETWCPNCRKEVGFINDFDRRFGDRGVRLIGVTNHTKGQTDATLKAYVEQHGFQFPIAVDRNGRTAQAFGGGTVPTLVLIDGPGTIRWHDHPAALEYAVVDTLLQESTGKK